MATSMFAFVGQFMSSNCTSQNSLDSDTLCCGADTELPRACSWLCLFEEPVWTDCSSAFHINYRTWGPQLCPKLSTGFNSLCSSIHTDGVIKLLWADLCCLLQGKSDTTNENPLRNKNYNKTNLKGTIAIFSRRLMLYKEWCRSDSTKRQGKKNHVKMWVLEGTYRNYSINTSV